MRDDARHDAEAALRMIELKDCMVQLRLREPAKAKQRNERAGTGSQDVCMYGYQMFFSRTQTERGTESKGYLLSLARAARRSSASGSCHISTSLSRREHVLGQLSPTMFYEGPLQDGIELAVRESKLVVCFVRGSHFLILSWMTRVRRH